MAEPVDLEEAKALPVVLFNGKHRINVGDVEIPPTLDYKQFRVVLNQMIGISYNNLTTYLVDEEAIQREQRKILITGKINLSGLVREKTCYFLVVLKRSRRDRRRKPNKQIGAELIPPFRPLQQEFDMNVAQIPASATCFSKIWFHESQLQRANYINFMILNSNCGFGWPMNAKSPKMIEPCPRVQRCRNRELCADCTNADRQGKEPTFHLCVYDQVVEGFFRSPFGPICRPR
ncbi:hypothetical protein L6452_24384 [Arctium lappa]|uniref:Uncharacterized protein n=1 Tax=Arctium lappa TaxID=4217 RepID=A0ACB9A8Q3_ARCLA|nr:hypothetical protein L6452_24384 [Arctium lappa]